MKDISTYFPLTGEDGSGGGGPGGITDIGDGNRLVRLSQVLKHVLNQNGTLCDIAI